VTPSSKELTLQPPVLSTEVATITTATISIHILRVGAKQVTLALFRQVPALAWQDVTVATDTVWGTVRYAIGDAGMRWAVVERAGALYRVAVEWIQDYRHETPWREARELLESQEKLLAAVRAYLAWVDANPEPPHGGGYPDRADFPSEAEYKRAYETWRVETNAHAAWFREHGERKPIQFGYGSQDVPKTDAEYVAKMRDEALRLTHAVAWVKRERLSRGEWLETECARAPQLFIAV
jgi:hypothetical protein